MFLFFPSAGFLGGLRAVWASSLRGCWCFWSGCFFFKGCRRKNYLNPSHFSAPFPFNEVSDRDPLWCSALCVGDTRPRVCGVACSSLMWVSNRRGTPFRVDQIRLGWCRNIWSHLSRKDPNWERSQKASFQQQDQAFLHHLRLGRVAFIIPFVHFEEW